MNPGGQGTATLRLVLEHICRADFRIQNEDTPSKSVRVEVSPSLRLPPSLLGGGHDLRLRPIVQASIECDTGRMRDCKSRQAA
jgi:hypothetical protein